MTRIEVLVEGAADVPVITEVLQRRFGLTARQHFRIHPHQGIGKLPQNPLAKPNPKRLGLLDLLPTTLRGYGKWLDAESFVLVVIDSDDTPCTELLSNLNKMLRALPSKPRVLFRLAIEETESWFIADTSAVLKAYPKAKVAPLKKIAPDAIVGAWEKLALSIGSTGSSGTDKRRWAEKICPHLNLENPPSPSLQKLISGIARELQLNKP